MQKPFSFLTVLLVVLFCLPCTQSFGWISTGHKIVAFIAWDDLTPKTKAAVTELLKQHHRYKEDLLLDAPVDQTDDERARTAFATAATWPDMVRSQSNPMSFTHNHPAWHFIDIPFIEKGAVPATQPASGPGPQDIVEALTQCTAEIKDPKTSSEEKAVDLCWIEHLIGDIHQPLHAVSMFSPDLPTGDRGGNSLTVLREAAYSNTQTNLHLLWDSLPGNFASEEPCIYEARGLRAEPKYSREKLKDLLAVTDFMAWAKESHQLAVDDAYLNGDLKAAVTKGGGRRGATGDPIPGVPPGYLEKAEHVAMQQVTLAGYRLADQLNAIFDPK